MKASSVYLIDKLTKEVVCYFDYANDFQLSLSSENIFATGKGKNMISFNGEMTGTIEFSSEIFTEDLLKAKLGQDMIVANKDIMKREVLTVADEAVTITGTPVGDAITVYELHSGSTVEHKALIPEVALEGKDIVLAGLENGTKVVVYYMEETTDVKSVKLGLGKNKKSYEIRAKVLGKDVMGQDCFLELCLDNCSAELNVELSLDAKAPSSISTTFNLLANDEGDFGELIFL